MPYEEFLKWITFFERNPEGWREDQRAYMIMTSMGGSKTRAEDIFPSIRQMKTAEAKRKANSEDNQIKPSGLFLDKMLSAKGGDESGWTFKGV